MWCFRSPSSRSSSLGCVADEPRLLHRPDDEQRGRGAVVGAARGVLGDAAAELAEGQDRDAVGLAGVGQVLVERGDRVGELVEQGRVGAELVGVGVEAVERGVVDPRAEAGLDDLRDQFQPPRQAEVGVRRLAGVVLVELFEPLARVVGREGAPAEEAEQRVAAGRSSRATRSSASRTSRFGRRRRRAGAGTVRGVVSDGTSVFFALKASGKERAPTCRPGMSPPTSPALRVEGAAEPAGLQGAVLEPGGLPDLHRAEVRAVGVGVADALDDRGLARSRSLAISPIDGVQADLVGDLVDLPRRQPQGPAGLGVAVEPVRHDGVQAVVAAEELDDDEDAVVRLGVDWRPAAELG